jgi:hypothetical protein
MLVLEQLETAIQQKIDADIEQYSKNLEPYFREKEKKKKEQYFSRVQQRFLHTFGVDSLGSMVDTAGRRASRDNNEEPEKATDTVKIWGKLGDIRNGRLYYDFYNGTRSLELSQPLSRLMGDLEHSFPSDFYSAFLFLKTDIYMATTLYKSNGVPIGLKIPVDSLLTNSKGAFYPGIADLHTGGQAFKLFYIPLTRGQLTFALCGIKDATTYTQALDEIPATFIYPLAITLLLLLIGLPLIKFYTIGPTEAIGMGDAVGVGLSLLCGSMVITVIIIQLILLKDGDARMQIGMEDLSGQIDRSFRHELDTAFTQLQAIDERRALDPGHWKKNAGLSQGAGVTPPNTGVTADSALDVSDSLVAFLKSETDNRDPLLPYLNFDRVYWVNAKGQQTVTASVDTGAPVFTDVSERAYYKAFVDNTAYRLPGLDSSLVGIEPVLSWIDGAFRVVMARRSACPGAFLATIGLDLYSVNHTVLPSGYGFCLIDADGLVQMHSEPSRNLVENFLKESEDASMLKAAINGRQTLYLASTNLYGKQYGLYLTPVRGMPYYLVVFYDKGYILPVNLRILVFSLIGCLVTLVFCLVIVCGILWWRFFRRQGRFRPLLFGPMDYLRVLLPLGKYAAAYSLGALVLEGYVVGMLVLTVLGHPYSGEINGVVVLLLLASPILLAFALWLIAKLPGGKDNSDYLKSYSFLVQVLVVALGVLPAALYTWHAQNQEILQSVKREQLLKANLLQDRRTALYQPLAPMYPALPIYKLYTYWQYQTGIYSLYRDSLALTHDSFSTPSPPSILEDEYFSVAERFGPINYDPQYIPVLKNQSADREWQWNTIKENNALPFAFTQAPDVHMPGTGDGGRTKGLAPPQRLTILSTMPKRYPYLGHAKEVVLLVAFITLLLAGMRRLVRRVATELFMQKWTKGNDAEVKNAGLPLMDDYLAFAAAAGEVTAGGTATGEVAAGGTAAGEVVKMRASMLAEIAVEPLSPESKEVKMDEKESSTVAAVGVWSGYFQWLFFRQCGSIEQYVLYHFACKGFLNYKNVQPIDHLLQIGILVKQKGQLQFFSRVFRAWLRMNVREDLLDKKMIRKSDWQRFRIPFLVLLTIAAAFLFLTRQEAWQRMLALLTALGTALGSWRSVFGRMGGGDEKPG